LRFDLSEAHIRHLMDFVEVELMKIIEH